MSRGAGSHGNSVPSFLGPATLLPTMAAPFPAPPAGDNSQVRCSCLPLLGLLEALAPMLPPSCFWSKSRLFKQALAPPFPLHLACGTSVSHSCKVWKFCVPLPLAWLAQDSCSSVSPTSPLLGISLEACHAWTRPQPLPLPWHRVQGPLWA